MVPKGKLVSSVVKGGKEIMSEELPRPHDTLNLNFFRYLQSLLRMEKFG
jgi:hypothetical protein